MTSTDNPVVPRPAVAGIVRAPDGRILLGRRNPELKFMGGYYAFPGGAVDADDNDGAKPDANRNRKADAIALVRELFEETGLLLVAGEKPSASTLRQAREALLDETLRFNDFLADHDLTVDENRFQPCGAFVTPEMSPRRFHARYYLADGVEVGDEELIEGELVALDWMSAEEARRRWRDKELDLAPPVAYVLRQFEKHPLDSALNRLQTLEPMTTDHAHCHEARVGIQMMPLRTPTLPPARHTNCLIVGESERYIIDPAATTEEEQTRLTQQLDYQTKEEGATIAAVLLTHSHGDHTGSATLVRERYGAPIWAHEKTAHELDFAVDRHLVDDERIDVAGGWTLRCLHTPGHHPGHLCFLEETSGTLMSGDMVAGSSSIVIAHGHGGDMAAYMDSMQRLMEVSCDLMIPSHGDGFNDPRQTIQNQINHRLGREAKIKRALDSGLSGIDELLEAAYDDAPRELWKLAEHTLKAHLIRLGITEFDK